MQKVHNYVLLYVWSITLNLNKIPVCGCCLTKSEKVPCVQIILQGSMSMQEVVPAWGLSGWSLHVLPVHVGSLRVP